MKMKYYLYLSVIVLFLTSCELFDKISEPSLSQSIEMIEHEWTVDSLHYTLFKIDGTVVKDTIMPLGRMVFGDKDLTDPKLLYNSGFVIHTYILDGIEKIDTSAWSPGTGIDAKFQYVNMYFYDKSIKMYSGEKTIFDIKELSKDKLSLYRFEMLQDIKTGSYYGKARYSMQMHR